MENKDTKAIDDNSSHVSKFIKLSPDSISKINKEENLAKKIDQDFCKITRKISEKLLKIKDLDSALQQVNYKLKGRENHEASNEAQQRSLSMILDELNAMIKPTKNGDQWFGKKLDKNGMNYLKLHGSNSLVEEKQILRDINIHHQKDLASSKSPSHFYDLSFASKMRKEVEQLRIEHLERASPNDSVIGNVSKYESLKKSLEDQIKVLSDDTLRNNRECVEYCGIRGRQDVKEREASLREIYSLIAKLREKQKKKDEAYHRILKLKNWSNEEILYCKQLINRVHQLREEKDVAALDEMSNLEVGKFMIKWKNDKGQREIYVKRVLLSLELRQVSKHRKSFQEEPVLVEWSLAPAPSISGRCNHYCVGPVRQGGDMVLAFFKFYLSGSDDFTSLPCF